jgi:hypothetical protein
MKPRMHRTQILLEPAQHQALSEIAQREKRSLSDLVREMLQVQLGRREHAAASVKQRRMEALAQIQRHRQAILDRRGGRPLEIDAVDLINQIRDERDGELTGVIPDRD